MPSELHLTKMFSFHSLCKPPFVVLLQWSIPLSFPTHRPRYFNHRIRITSVDCNTAQSLHFTGTEVMLPRTHKLHHKYIKGSGCKAPRILTFECRYGRVIYLTLQPFYSRRKNSGSRWRCGWVNPRTFLIVLPKKETLLLARIKPRSLNPQQYESSSHDYCCQ